MRRLIFLIIFSLLLPVSSQAARQTGTLELMGRTATRLAEIDASLDIVSVTNLCNWIATNITFLTCTDDLDGTITIDFVADYADISTNDTATDVTGSELETLTDGSNADSLHSHVTSGFSGDLLDSTSTKIATVTNGLITSVVFTIAVTTDQGLYRSYIPTNGLGVVGY